MRMILLFLVPLTLLLACQEEPMAKEKQRDIFQGQIGDTLADGAFVFHIFESGKDVPPERLPVYIQEDYGFIVFDIGTKEEAAFLIKLGCPAAGWIKEFSDLVSLREFVREIPANRTIGYYGITCGGPTHYELPDSLVKEIFEIFKTQGLVEIEGHHQTTCSCPAT